MGGKPKSEVSKIESQLQQLGMRLDELVAKARTNAIADHKDVADLKGKLDLARARIAAEIARLTN